jgi:AraC-like DNA-binding protein
MPTSPAASLLVQDPPMVMGDTDLLPRYPVFRAQDLELAREYLAGVLAPHRSTYRTRERQLVFRHQGVKLGAVELNAMQFGGDIMIDAPHFPDYYLLQFMLAGSCRVEQGGCSYEMRPASVAVINPCQPFKKSWAPAGRQLVIRIEQSLLQRECCAWTGRDHNRRIEFDQSRVFVLREVGALAQAVRMLCAVLREESSGIDHPLVRNRIASTLASAMLVELPHSRTAAFEAVETAIAPASVRRAERFMEENAANTIGLADVASAAGVSARALQMAFRSFRDTTPMAHLRALRLELARRELARIGRDGGSVTSVAIAHSFGSLSRFAAHYRARFHESPSDTLRHGSARYDN